MRPVFAVLLLTFDVGCDTKPADTESPTNPVSRWQAYNSQDQTFQAKFPSTSAPWKTEFESPDYGHTDVYHVSTEFDGAVYGVSFNDYPRALADAEVKSELRNTYTLPDTGADVLATTEIEMANIPILRSFQRPG